MEKVIILKGAERRGKTQTLKIFIDNLIKGSSASIVFQKDYIADFTTDCFVVLDVPNFGKIGVITFGDPGCEECVREALEECLKHDCKAVIGSSRTRESSTYLTIYAILWRFGQVHNTKTVETTTIVAYSGFGQPLNYFDLNVICAENLKNLLFKL